MPVNRTLPDLATVRNMVAILEDALPKFYRFRDSYQRIMDAHQAMLDALKDVLLDPECRHTHTQDCTHDNCAFYRAYKAISLAELK